VALIPEESMRSSLTVTSQAQVFVILDQIYQHVQKKEREFNLGTARAEQVLMQLLYSYKFREG